MVPDWYADFFRDEAMREADPFGYGMGLAIGYVIVPGIIAALVLAVMYAAWKRHRV